MIKLELGLGERLLAVSIPAALAYKYYSLTATITLLIGGLTAYYLLVSFFVGNEKEKVSNTVEPIVLCAPDFYCYVRYAFGYFRRRGIPSPPASFPFGNLGDLLSKPMHELDMNWAEAYGKVYGFFFNTEGRTLSVLDTDILREILVKDVNTFTNRRQSRVQTEVNNLSSKMLTNLTDQHWKDVRNTLTPAFTSGKMKAMMTLIEGSIDTLSEKCGEAADQSQPMDVKEKFGNFTMEVISKAAFATESDAQHTEKDPFVENAKVLFGVSFKDPGILFMILFTELTILLNKLFDFVPFGRKVDAFFRDAVGQILAQRKGQKDTHQFKDFVQILVNSQTIEGGDKINETDLVQDKEIIHKNLGGHKTKLTQDEMVAQSMLFLLAGYETTASTLQFMAHLLASHPDIQERLHDEITEVLNGERPTYEMVNKIPLLEATMMETLRFYPPAVRTERLCGQDTEIKGLCIEKGVVVSIPIYVIHHSEEFYPDPEKFDPDRFMGEEKAKRDPITYLPFGYGPRNCIGMRFAQMEIKLAMANLLTKYRFVLAEDTEVGPVYKYVYLVLNGNPRLFSTKKMGLHSLATV